MLQIGYRFPKSCLLFSKMGCVTRRRQTLLALLLLIFVPFCAFILFAEPDLSMEQELTSKMAELQMKIQHLDSLHRERLQEVRTLSYHLSRVIAVNQKNGDNSSVGASGMNTDAMKLLRNLTGSEGGSKALHMPSVYHFLPHLLHNADSLKPAFQLSKTRSGVEMVLGVPTVKREVQTYLLTTLHNLVQNLDADEQSKTLIIVFVAETDLEYVETVAKEIEMQFSPHVEAGLIEVISPPSSYYPDLTNLTPSLGDPPERFRWRTKQNLDFAFLMMYAQPRGVFYTQLEDDILAKPGFLTTMLKFAYDKIANNQPWFVIEFCQLGFIGKMFKCVELPWLVEFFIMFYTDKPVDWLLDHVITTKICSLDKDQKMCKKAKNNLWLHFKPSLFQHIGTHSSLKGKVQKLKDKHFGKLVLFYPHTNPKAVEVKGGITSYKHHTLARCYAGEDFFWGLSPQAGDVLSFKYEPPINLSRYLFRSGNAEHPADRFYNTTVEILPVKKPGDDLNVSPEGYVTVGKFDTVGIAEGFINPKLFPIKELRLNIHSESDNWVILNEILVETEQMAES